MASTPMTVSTSEMRQERSRQTPDSTARYEANTARASTQMNGGHTTMVRGEARRLVLAAYEVRFPSKKLYERSGRWRGSVTTYRGWVASQRR